MNAILLLLALSQLSPAAADSLLVWHDEFDVPGLPDPTRWDWDEGGSGMGNNEAQYYTRNRLANARVEGGELVITARREDTLTCWYGPCKFTSARLVTRGRASWLYGRVDVRAKLPKGKGVWPAIWMLAEQSRYGGWPGSGEIDIMEHVGHEPTRVYGTVHTLAYNHKIGTSSGSSKVVSDPSANWHVYSLEWGPDSLFIGVDGERYHRFGNERTWETWPFDQSFHLLLNFAVGGEWGGAQGVDSTIYPQEFRVDWVRVHKIDRGDGPYRLLARAYGSGNVTLAPAKTTYSVFDTVTATAAPEAGWEFIRWRMGAMGTVSPVKLLVDHSDTIAAVFLPFGEHIENGYFTDDLSGWTNWNDEAVPTSIAVQEGKACIKVAKAGADAWMSQFDWPGLRLVKGEVWELGFSAQTGKARPLSANLVMDHAPHGGLSSAWSSTLPAGTSRQTHRFTVQTSDSVARFEFDFGTDTTRFCLDSVSLRRISSGSGTGPRHIGKAREARPGRDAAGRKSSDMPSRPFQVILGEGKAGRIEGR